MDAITSLEHLCYLEDVVKALDRLTAAVERLGAKEKVIISNDPPNLRVYGPPPKRPEPLTEDEKQRLLSNIHKPPATDQPRTCGECAMWPRHRPQNNIVCNAADFFGFDHPCTQPAIFQPREVTS